MPRPVVHAVDSACSEPTLFLSHRRTGVLFLFGDADQSHEFALTVVGAGTRSAFPRLQFSNSSTSATAGTTTITISPRSAGLLTVWELPSQLVLFADPGTAATFWAPVIRSLTASSVSGLKSYWRFSTNATVLVGEPYLVRNATLSDEGRTTVLRGDLNVSVPLTVVAPLDVKEVTWDGTGFKLDVRALLMGRLEESVSVRGVRVPTLEGWRFADRLPEVQSSVFDDSGWMAPARPLGSTVEFVEVEHGD